MRMLQMIPPYIVDWFCLILFFFKLIVNGLLTLLPVSKQLLIYEIILGLGWILKLLGQIWIFMVFIFTVVFTTCFIFLSVLVSESTSQVEKIRKKGGVDLSEHPVKPVWASCQQSQAFKNTAVCEPIPFWPLEASRMHLLSMFHPDQFKISSLATMGMIYTAQSRRS